MVVEKFLKFLINDENTFKIISTPTSMSERFIARTRIFVINFFHSMPRVIPSFTHVLILNIYRHAGGLALHR